MEKNQYQCVNCGGIFLKGWSDEKAKEEMLAMWGDLPEEEKAVICDDCFKKMHPEDNLEMARNSGYKL